MFFAQFSDFGIFFFDLNSELFDFLDVSGLNSFDLFFVSPIEPFNFEVMLFLKLCIGFTGFEFIDLAFQRPVFATKVFGIEVQGRDPFC